MTLLLPMTEINLIKGLSDASRDAAPKYLAAAHKALERLVAQPDLLDGVQLERSPGGFTRNLLFGDDDISVWVMVWGAGAKTPIHDHHCSCCFGVLSGQIRERRFRHVAEDRAVILEDATREAGYVACMMPTGENIHQMMNAGDGEAISIHIYGYDHHEHATSIERVYRLAAS
jgi:predicted metal-dependent enzyme (double-stranded beta helix superfamily)